MPQDYIANGGPVQGLRKLQALREQRAMQPQSPYGIIQEESQTLSHWSDLCAEVQCISVVYFIVFDQISKLTSLRMCRSMRK